MKRIIIITTCLLILAIGSIACGEASSNTGTVVSTSSGSSNTGSSQKSSSTPAPTTQHFKVGQTVKVGNTWQLVINSVKTSQGDSMDQPQKSGDVFLLVDVSMTNISSQEQDASSLMMWNLRDNTGQQYTETITTFATAPDGKVEANSPLRGTLAYEVPASTHSFTLAFQSDLLSNGQTVFDLNV